MRITWAAIAAAFSLAACAERDRSTTWESSERDPDGALYFPTGDRDTSLVRVERVGPGQIWAGHPFIETFKVSNITSRDLRDVSVRARLGPGFEPAEDLRGGELRDGAVHWTLERLAAGESRVLSLQGTVRAEGDLQSCVEVDLAPRGCETRKVAVAKLDMEATAPESVLVCERLPYTLTLRNGSRATLPDVRIDSELPEGLKTEADESRLKLFAGDLGPGETKTLALRLKPSRAGVVAPRFSAGSGPVTAEAAGTSTRVLEPVLTVRETFPEASSAGGTLRATITVTNSSDTPSHETRVEHRAAPPVRIVSADGARVSGDRAVWELGTLAPGESRELGITLSSNEVGSFEGVTVAKGHCARPAETRGLAAFKGVPALLVELVDSPDPVHADVDEAVYTIRVTNQGSARLTNVKVDGRLEGAEGTVRGEGATSGTSDGGTIDFQPVKELGPKARAEWKVSLRTGATADARFKVSVKADQIEKPVEEEESTHFVR